MKQGPGTPQRIRSNRTCARLVFFAGLLISIASFGQIQVRQYEFGNGSSTPPSSTRVTEEQYASERGYGFEGQSRPKVAAGCVTAASPFYFSIKADPGNYRVSVTLGDLAGESDTTIKAELRRLMVRAVSTKAGQFDRRDFIVNVRAPAFPGGRVRLKAPRETVDEAWAWDDKLTLEFNGRRPCVRTLQISPVDVPTVFLLGDSTVCDQPAEPYTSWGQILPYFFNPDVAIANHAESGETLRSSSQAHRFEKVLSLLKPGDYVLIQYGHNDMKSKAPNAAGEYKAMLTEWVDAVARKGGTPVLATSMNRHTFTGPTVVDSLGVYPGLVREVAAEKKVALIDLNRMSKTLYESLGSEGSIELFEHASGSKTFDPTHHSSYGAFELARCVVTGIRTNKLPLADHLSRDATVFDPVTPDRAADVMIPPSPVMAAQKPLGN